ncbi:MAG TPA: NUDIX hydrolase [Candidatus Saccharibacteria bacterium]|nr:NUDIX hydrolase [Candidatus Saccharibacteria bacterium]
MSKEYTEDENKIWRASQPQKMVVVKVVIKSDQGNVLLAKPDYKKTWQLPGGGVNDHESPEAAAVREVKEELDLDISEGDLLIKGTIYKPDEEILFVIYESSKTISEDTQFELQSDEITDYKFIPAQDVAPLLSGYYSDFWSRNYR